MKKIYTFSDKLMLQIIQLIHLYFIMKSILITGANKGIGFEAARQLGKAGYYIFVTARDEAKGLIALKELENVKGEFVQLDVCDVESIKRAFKIVASKIDRLDVLINNAGILIDKSGILKAGYELIHKTINTNSIAPLLITQIFDSLLKSGSRVINVSSNLGAKGNGMSEYAPVYSISKAALNAVTCQLSLTYRNRGVSVNSVNPGWVKTDMGGRGASRSVEKGAESIVWLATVAPPELTGKFISDKQVIPW
jgi:NAD(P)-dependent dehydrogenase (short-subunit alcohol dehydrogenase family)